MCLSHQTKAIPLLVCHVDWHGESSLWFGGYEFVFPDYTFQVALMVQFSYENVCWQLMMFFEDSICGDVISVDQVLLY